MFDVLPSAHNVQWGENHTSCDSGGSGHEEGDPGIRRCNVDESIHVIFDA